MILKNRKQILATIKRLAKHRHHKGSITS